MVERIRQILQTRQLSPTQFADALGLARPIISHVLSGRNKPSLEVVQKIIAAFPDISLPWLLSGQGPMLATVDALPAPPALVGPENGASPSPGPSQRPKRTAARAPEATAPAAAALSSSAQPVAAMAAPPPPMYAAPVPESLEALRPAPPVVEAPPAPAPAVAMAAAAPQNAPQAPAVPAPAAPDVLAAFAEPGKTIRRIVIFYYDGTFSAYQPETPS